MPRPRSIPDEDLLDSALAVMRRAGPEGITFQSVAAETGLSGATLVQRFGSKQALMRAALVRAWDILDERTAKAIGAAPRTPEGAIGILVALSADYGEGDDFAEGFLALREDLRSPGLRRRGVKWGDVLAEALGRRLRDRRGSRPDLGRLMAAQWQGIVIWWGFSRKGSLRRAVAAELRRWCKAIGKD